jgi:hypothetical protein
VTERERERERERWGHNKRRNAASKSDDISVRLFQSLLDCIGQGGIVIKYVGYITRWPIWQA